MKTMKSMGKVIIAIIAALNIVAIMLFEYKLPLLQESASEQAGEAASSQIQDANTDESEVGTIEAVEKEEAHKETEAAESALAKADDEEEFDEDEEEKDPDAPLLELTDSHVYLKVGDRFNYMSYIKTMEDVDGSDLSRYIHLDKDVDTWEPGEIELTYRITSAITGKSSSKVLLITITE